jgi:hypothetical protein
MVTKEPGIASNCAQDHHDCECAPERLLQGALDRLSCTQGNPGAQTAPSRSLHGSWISLCANVRRNGSFDGDSRLLVATS